MRAKSTTSPLAHVDLAATEVPASPPDVIAFAKGLPGFETCRGFVLFASDSGDIQRLSAVDGSASFLAIDPRRVQPGYRCQLSDGDRHSLGGGADDTLLWLALLMVEPDGAITVNLRAPIVINPALMRGQQVIPYQCIYPLRHVLVAGC